MQRLEPIKMSEFVYPEATSPNKGRDSGRKCISPKLKQNRKSYRSVVVDNPEGLQRSETEAKIFNKFSYENYRKFPHLNPFEPKRSNTVLAGQKLERLPFSYNKNIEMVYCKNRLEEFQGLLNGRLQTINSLKPTKGKSNSIKRLSVPLSSRLAGNQDSPKKPFRIARGKSVLMNVMKEFNQLLKISSLISPEETSPTHNISLQALQRRYPFFKHLDNLVLNRVLKALQIQTKSPKVQITLRDFILISSLFILRDATPCQLGQFLDRFLFGDDPIQMSTAQQVLSRLQGPAKKHARVKQDLGVFFSDSQPNFRKWSQRHLQFCQHVIDLLIGNNS